jgi:hypothetical protein
MGSLIKELARREAAARAEAGRLPPRARRLCHQPAGGMDASARTLQSGDGA